MVEPAALGQAMRALPESGQDKASVASGRASGDAIRLDQRDRPPALCDFPRARETRQPAPDHAHVDIEVERERGPLPHPRGSVGIPGCGLTGAPLRKFVIHRRTLYTNFGSKRAPANL